MWSRCISMDKSNWGKFIDRLYIILKIQKGKGRPNRATFADYCGINPALLTRWSTISFPNDSSIESLCKGIRLTCEKHGLAIDQVIDAISKAVINEFNIDTSQFSIDVDRNKYPHAYLSHIIFEIRDNICTRKPENSMHESVMVSETAAESNTQEQCEKPMGSTKLKKTVVALFCILTVIAAAVCSLLLKQSKEAWISIDNGSIMPEYFTVNVEQASPIKGHIWVFVSVYDSIKNIYVMFYPQSMNPALGEGAAKVNEKWECGVHLGRPDDSGKKFKLTVVVADNPANESIASSIQRWIKNGNYEGFHQLPAGCRMLKEVEVIRSPEKIGMAPEISRNIFKENITVENNLQDGDNVPQYATFKGKYDKDIGGRKVWVLVYSNNCKWYPQYENSEMGNGIWKVDARFGDKENANDIFYASVISADKEADTALRKICSEWINKNQYPGLYTIELPGGIDEKMRFKVIRK